MAVCNRVGIAIATGVHPQGSILSGEVELSKQLGVSRSVVREAIRMLASKGMVESRPKIGTRVRAREDWNLLDPQLLGWMFEGTPPLNFVRELFELRMIVEPAAAQFAALRRNSRHLSLIGHALEQMAQHPLSTPLGQQADQQFHAAILTASGNDFLIGLTSGIASAIRWTTVFKYRSPVKPHDPIPQHRVLFDAIAAGDAAAARTATETLIREALADTENALAAR